MFPAMPESQTVRLGYAIKLAQHGVRSRMDEALRATGLTTPQYGAMCALEAEPGMSNAKLARALFVTPQTMHGILSVLEREELVERRPDANHGKRIGGTLSKKGKQVLGEAHRRVAVVEARLAAGLSASEAAALAEAFIACAQRLA
jgi:DNA-binding MarR family transcriptional regulator